jgi:hypothetical protein
VHQLREYFGLRIDATINAEIAEHTGWTFDRAGLTGPPFFVSSKHHAESGVDDVERRGKDLVVMRKA